jgi:hypothetical protein
MNPLLQDCWLNRHAPRLLPGKQTGRSLQFLLFFQDFFGIIAGAGEKRFALITLIWNS